MTGRLFIGLWSFAVAASAWAGPPFTTDDPEPVAYRHFEINIGSQLTRDSGGWSGSPSFFEINYGALPEFQLHLIAPAAFDAPDHGPNRFGYGDTELGAKYRFVQESDFLPQIGTFPLVELPSGDSSRGLGNGRVDAFFPLWLQKEFGPWTVSGGGGYWLNPGEGNRSWWLTGLELQRKMNDHLTLGAELIHETARSAEVDSDTRFNLGAVVDLSETYHLLISAGHSIQGPGQFQAYVALQITFGLEKPAEKSKP